MTEYIVVAHLPTTDGQAKWAWVQAGLNAKTRKTRTHFSVNRGRAE